MGILTNKGQKSRTESYELASTNERTGASLLVLADVKIENGRLAGIENGRVIDESQNAAGQTTIMPVVTWYRTSDGREILTGSAEVEKAETAAPLIREFVERIEELLAPAEPATADEKGGEA